MRALFLINGLGLGNSTRCHAIIQCLHDSGCDVDIVTSGNGLWYFQNQPAVASVHTIKPLQYGVKDGKISIFRTLLYIPRMMARIGGNARVIAEVMRDRPPDVIVTDSDYNILLAGDRHAPLVALNNSDVVVCAYRKYHQDRPRSIRAQFHAVEYMDFRYHKHAVDLALSPSLDPGLRQTGLPFFRIPPIVRRGYDPDPYGKGVKRVVIMLSGSRFGSPVRLGKRRYPFHIDIVGRQAPPNQSAEDGIVFHGKIPDTRPVLQGADLVIVNGGFSAVSELFCMRKPMVVVPVPHHAEQWVNARTVVGLGVGGMAEEENIEAAMLAAVDKIDDYRSGYEALGDIGNGARAGADAILRIARDGRL